MYVKDAVELARNMTELEYAKNVIALIRTKSHEPAYYGLLSELVVDFAKNSVHIRLYICLFGSKKVPSALRSKKI